MNGRAPRIMQFGCAPSAPRFRQWTQAMREATRVASGGPDECLTRPRAIEDAATIRKALAGSGELQPLGM
eukprot:5043687-Pyramimonas_sp.AAC.1